MGWNQHFAQHRARFLYSFAEQAPNFLVDATMSTTLHSYCNNIVLIGHYFFSPLWVHIKEASVTSARDASLAFKSANPTLICVT
jgi:hypothetical protein